MKAFMMEAFKPTTPAKDTRPITNGNRELRLRKNGHGTTKKSRESRSQGK